MTQEQTLQRIDELKDSSILPLDEDGSVLADDETALQTGVELRLLLQRLLDLDVKIFLNKMSELYFHLFAVDHDHYRDLLTQAMSRDPLATRDFCLNFIRSEDVIFFDDQRNLHSLLDVLENLGLSSLPEDEVAALRAIVAEPFFRQPRVLARLIRFVAPVLSSEEWLRVRELFEMDLIPATELTWSQVVPFLKDASIPRTAPTVRLVAHRHRLKIDDFDDLRWGLGIEGSVNALRFRMLGALVAAGPAYTEKFILLSEIQPETAFQQANFETAGQREFFARGLALLRAEVLRDVHRSTEWFDHLPPERQWPWHPPSIYDSWPKPLRYLTMNWSEFANALNGLPVTAHEQILIQNMDRKAEEIFLLVQKHPLATTEQLAEGDRRFRRFQDDWSILLEKILPELDVLP